MNSSHSKRDRTSASRSASIIRQAAILRTCSAALVAIGVVAGLEMIRIDRRYRRCRRVPVRWQTRSMGMDSGSAACPRYAARRSMAVITRSPPITRHRERHNSECRDPTGAPAATAQAGRGTEAGLASLQASDSVVRMAADAKACCAGCVVGPAMHRHAAQFEIAFRDPGRAVITAVSGEGLR